MTPSQIRAARFSLAIIVAATGIFAAAMSATMHDCRLIATVAGLACAVVAIALLTDKMHNSDKL